MSIQTNPEIVETANQTLPLSENMALQVDVFRAFGDQLEQLEELRHRTQDAVCDSVTDKLAWTITPALTKSDKKIHHRKFDQAIEITEPVALGLIDELLEVSGEMSTIHQRDIPAIDAEAIDRITTSTTRLGLGFSESDHELLASHSECIGELIEKYTPVVDALEDAAPLALSRNDIDKAGKLFCTLALAKLSILDERLLVNIAEQNDVQIQGLMSSNPVSKQGMELLEIYVRNLHPVESAKLERYDKFFHVVYGGIISGLGRSIELIVLNADYETATPELRQEIEQALSKIDALTARTKDKDVAAKYRDFTDTARELMAALVLVEEVPITVPQPELQPTRSSVFEQLFSGNAKHIARLLGKDKGELAPVVLELRKKCDNQEMGLLIAVWQNNLGILQSLSDIEKDSMRVVVNGLVKKMGDVTGFSSPVLSLLGLNKDTVAKNLTQLFTAPN